MAAYPVPKPYKLPYKIPAGVTSDKERDRYRSNVVVPMGEQLTYETSRMWHFPGTTNYSSLPDLILGHPFNTSKPRKGRWGETLNTKSTDAAALFDEVWEKMKVSRRDRENIALDEAKKELQKKIDYCLYGEYRH